MRLTWDEYFLSIASLVSTRSKDPRTKVGAVIVLDRRIVATGYNDFPPGIEDRNLERWEIPTKYFFVSHAERGAIDMAARDGVALKGCTIYITLPPCVECAKSIIRCGIVEVVIGNPAPSHWSPVDNIISLLEEAKVKVRFI